MPLTRVPTPNGAATSMTRLPYCTDQDPHRDRDRVPRMSAPVSFLPMRTMLVVLALVVALFPSAVLATGADCVCSYDSSKDYFANKVSIAESTQFSVTYHKSYKKVEFNSPFTGVARTYYLYLCGTPLPAGANVNNSVQIPIRGALLQSSTYTPYIAYLGKRPAIHYVPTAPVHLSECFQKLRTNGELFANTAYDPNTYAYKPFSEPVMPAANLSTLKDLVRNPVDATMPASVFFVDQSSLSTNENVARSVFGADAPILTVAMGDTKDPTIASQMEWIKYMSLFFNTEAQANSVYANVLGRFYCSVAGVQTTYASSPKPKVFYGAPYRTKWYGSPCSSNVHCSAVVAAGGQFIDWATSANGYTGSGFTDAQILPFIQQADVWIFPDGTWNGPSVYGESQFFTGSRATFFANVSAVVNQQVYDVLGVYLADWFDLRPAQPDVYVLDYLNVFFNANPSRVKTFLRNVFTSSGTPQVYRTGSNCPDVAAPLYSDWLSGPCSTLSTQVPYNATQPLCASSTSSAVHAAAGSAAVLLFSVMLAFVWM